MAEKVNDFLDRLKDDLKGTKHPVHHCKMGVLMFDIEKRELLVFIDYGWHFD